jgi:apolipoprotein N-acyltransferase
MQVPAKAKIVKLVLLNTPFMMMKKSIRFSLLAFFLLICTWTGYEMVERGSRELLWGYRPLFFFLSAWGAVTMIRLHRFAKDPGGLRWLGLSTLSGVLLGFGFPGIIPMPLIMFAAFVPLLMVEREIAQQYDKAKRDKVLRYAYHTFVIWNVMATYWVTNTALIAGFVAIWANAFLMVIPWLLFHTTRKLMPKVAYLSLVAYWLTFEYIHLQWELTWPWLTLGNSFAEYPSWVQWYEYTGVFGGGLWIWGGNLLALSLWTAYRQKQKLVSAGAKFIALIVLPIVLSLVIYYQYEEQGVPRDIVVVQPNYEPHYQKFNIKESIQVDRFLSLTRQLVDEETDYVVYPETSFGLVRINDANQYRAIRTIREALKEYPGLKVVTGIDGYYVFKDDEPHTPHVRVQDKGRAPMYYEIVNAAIQITIGEDEVPLYRKSKLVPGPEIFPYKDLLFFFEPVVERLDGTTAGVATQEERDVLVSEAGKVAPAICYESVFGEYVTGYIHKGAQAIFIMTNDGWWDNTAGHRQHLHFASLRSIETRRSIARSANTGISAFINQRGDILQPTQYNEPTAIRQSILFNDTSTFYVRWGDFIARIALFTSIILILNSFVRSRIK